ncbi:MAG: HigA family addiction module antitoxin [Albidovulum sp.]|nr:HigA family addiction module antitoxin [Albidovulum sp.]
MFLLEKDMPLPFFAIAIPVLHSSGAWIASTAASGYIAGTLSSTWIGAFVLGNSSLLSALGLVSAAGIYGAASSGLAALGSGVALGMGAALTKVGLGGVASALGIAPVVTFLGLTPVGWAIAVTAGTLITTLGYYFSRKTMQRMNEERQKGGLDPITLLKIVEEVKLLEEQSLQNILERLEKETDNVSLSSNREEVTIDGQVYSIARLKYAMNEDGSEEILFARRIGRNKRILLIKAATEVELLPAHPGEFIQREVIEALELGEAEMARILGVGQAVLSDLLNGKSELSPELALRLEKAFGIGMDMLLHMQAEHSAAQMRASAAAINVQRFHREGEEESDS